MEAIDIGVSFAKILRNYFLPMVCVVAIIWALWVGGQFLMAKDESGRNNAKKRLMSAISSVLIISCISASLFVLKLEFVPKEIAPPTINYPPDLPPWTGGSNGPAGSYAYKPSSGTGSGRVNAPEKKHGLLNPVKFAEGKDYATDFLVAESITAGFGTRRLSSLDDIYFYDEYLRKGKYEGPAGNNTPTLMGKGKAAGQIEDPYTGIVLKTKDKAETTSDVTTGAGGLDQKRDTDRRRLARGEVPEYLLEGDGLYENNFGIEINTLDGEGLVRYNTFYPQVPIAIKSEKVPSTSFLDTANTVAGNDMLAVGLTVEFIPADYAKDEWDITKDDEEGNTNYMYSTMSRPREDRLNGIVDNDLVSLWQNPLLIKRNHDGWFTDSPTDDSITKDNTYYNLRALKDGRRIMSAARAAADGVVVACGNTETDSMYDSAWVLIRHTKPISNEHYESYTFYGGLYGAVKMHDEFIKVYHTRPNAYNLSTDVSNKISADTVGKEAALLGGWQYGGNPIEGFYGPEAVPSNPPPFPPTDPDQKYKVQFVANSPIYDKPRANFGPGYFTYDGVIFEGPGSLNGTSPNINRQEAAKTFDRGDGKATGRTFKLLTNDPSMGTYTDDVPYTNSNGSKKYWFPTSVFNEDFDLDYNAVGKAKGSNTALGRTAHVNGYVPSVGTADANSYDKALIGRQVKAGDFIGYVGGGLLDPGAGTKKGSNYNILKPGGVYDENWDYGPDARKAGKHNKYFVMNEEVPNYYDTAKDDFNKAIQDILDGEKGINTQIKKYHAALDKFNAAVKFMIDCAATHAAMGNTFQPAEYPALFKPGAETAIATANYPLTLTPKSIAPTDTLDIFPGINSFTERHLNYRVYGMGKKAYDARNWPNTDAFKKTRAHTLKPDAYRDLNIPEDIMRMWSKGGKEGYDETGKLDAYSGAYVNMTSMSKPVTYCGVRGDTFNPEYYYNLTSGKRGRPLVALSAGHLHGQKDSTTGTAAPDSKKAGYYTETEGVLSLALETAFYLREHRMNVLQTRQDNVTLVLMNDSATLSRTSMALAVNADIYFSIHRDGHNQGGPNFNATTNKMHIIIQNEISTSGHPSKNQFSGTTVKNRPQAEAIIARIHDAVPGVIGESEAPNLMETTNGWQDDPAKTANGVQERGQDFAKDKNGLYTVSTNLGELTSTAGSMSAMLFEAGHIGNIRDWCGNNWYENFHSEIANQISNGIIADGIDWSKLNQDIGADYVGMKKRKLSQIQMQLLRPANLCMVMAEGRYGDQSQSSAVKNASSYKDYYPYTNEGNFMARTLGGITGTPKDTGSVWPMNDVYFRHVRADADYKNHWLTSRTSATTVGGEISRLEYNFPSAEISTEISNEPTPLRLSATASEGPKNPTTVGKDLYEALQKYVLPIAAVAGILWALWIGIQFLRATSEQTRQQAKSRLVKAIATVLIIAVCMLILKAFDTMYK